MGMSGWVRQGLKTFGAALRRALPIILFSCCRSGWCLRCSACNMC